MKLLIIALLYSLFSFASEPEITYETAEPEVDVEFIDTDIDEMEDSALQITEIESLNEEAKAYMLSDIGVFAISNETFEHLDDANGFCESLSDVTEEDSDEYSLISYKVAYGLTLIGFPFPQVLETSLVELPLLGPDVTATMRSGLIVWVNIPSEYDFGNSVFAFTNGNGPGAGDLQNAGILSDRFVENGLDPLSIQAICYDQDIRNFLE